MRGCGCFLGLVLLLACNGASARVLGGCDDLRDRGGRGLFMESGFLTGCQK